ncbi:MAG: ATP-binding protein [Alphaproteobacteria bacterium]|nr:ATP-binding protein [Alphaproteobacteria bacterium]
MAASLVGFGQRYDMLKGHLQMMLFPGELEKWSQRHYGKVVPLCEVIQQRHPLFLFSGDVGTGKTVMAECAANRITNDLGKDGFLLKLSTRVRGKGLHGEMNQLLQDAFEHLKLQAGKKRLAFLLVDEADSIASLRSTEQMHQEEKSAVNTLIQKIDEIRSVGGRAALFLCTNRAEIIDQAIVRRAALHMEFPRPTKEDFVELLEMDLDGMGLSQREVQKLASLISKGGHYADVGYTFSDCRLRFLPSVAMKALAAGSKATFDIFKDSVSEVKPSPSITP